MKTPIKSFEGLSQNPSSILFSETWLSHPVMHFNTITIIQIRSSSLTLHTCKPFWFYHQWLGCRRHSSRLCSMHAGTRQWSRRNRLSQSTWSWNGAATQVVHLHQGIIASLLPGTGLMHLNDRETKDTSCDDMEKKYSKEEVEDRSHCSSLCFKMVTALPSSV